MRALLSCLPSCVSISKANGGEKSTNEQIKEGIEYKIQQENSRVSTKSLDDYIRDKSLSVDEAVKFAAAKIKCETTNINFLKKYFQIGKGKYNLDFGSKHFSCKVTKSNNKSSKSVVVNFRLTSEFYRLLSLRGLGGETYVKKCEKMYPSDQQESKISSFEKKSEKASKLIDRFIDHADGDLNFFHPQTDNALFVEDDELKLSLSPNYNSQDQGDDTSIAVAPKDLVKTKDNKKIYKRFKRIMGAEGKNKNWIKDLEINKVPNKEIYSIKDKKSDLVFRLEVKKKGALLARPQETQTHSSVRWDKFARKLLKNANHKEALRRSLEDTKRINPIDASEGDGAASVSGAAVFAELGFKGSSFISPSKQQTPNHRTHELQGLGDVLGSSGEKGLETPKQGPNRNAGSLSPRQEEELIPSNAGSVKSGQGLGGDLEPLSDKQGMTNGFNFGQSNQNLDSSLTSIAGASDTGARYGLLYALGSLVGLGQSDEENSETDGSKSSTRGDRSWSDVGKSWGEFREDISGGRLSGTLTSAKTLIFGSNPLEGFDTQSSSNQ